MNKLYEVCIFQGGSQPPKEEWSTEKKEGYIRMLQIRDFTQSNKTVAEYVKLTNQIKMCNEDDILIARYGASIGKILTGIAGAYNVAMIKAIPDETIINKKYLYFYLRSSYFQNYISNVGSRAAQAGFNKEDLANLNINCPSLEKQEYIAQILIKTELIIELRKRQKRLLDDLIKAQFIEMFGDPTVNANGWVKITVKEAVKAGYIARPLDGNHGEKHPKGADYVPEGVPFIMAQDLKNNQVDFDNCYFITEKQAKTLTKGWAKTGDVLLTHKGTIGRIAIVQPSEYENILLTPQITYYRCLKDIDKEYLAAYFNTDFFNDQMQRLVTGATRACVTITQQEKLVLIIPPLEMQREFVSFVNQSDKSKVAIQKSLDEMQLLFNSLMQKYFE